MRIVFLDSSTMNPATHTGIPADINFDALRSLGDCTFYDRSPTKELVIERAQGAEIVLGNKSILDEDTLKHLPALRYIGVTATGYNVVDLQAAATLGITVTNVPAYSTPSVAQAVFALLLEMTNTTSHYAQRVQNGAWTQSRDFCLIERPSIELSGLTMGILGLGNIGLAVARIAQAFGMKIIANVRTERPMPQGIEACSLDEIFQRSDVLSLHCPLTATTKDLVNKTTLSLMKPTAFLINTSRGPLIDEQALADTLNAGHIAGAALDVLSVEPPTSSNPLFTAKNCLITPHIAWASRASRQRLFDTVVENIQAFLDGKPINTVRA
ncbi:MAG: D-2-hydroxyacid dehydrogenase [Alphaproteobacteria bacterium]|nr:D-2-hydroxyacid dehydrogenase [Alphaproteobacteria bacterium]